MLVTQSVRMGKEPKVVIIVIINILTSWKHNQEIQKITIFLVTTTRAVMKVKKRRRAQLMKVICFVTNFYIINHHHGHNLSRWKPTRGRYGAFRCVKWQWRRLISSSSSSSPWASSSSSYSWDCFGTFGVQRILVGVMIHLPVSWIHPPPWHTTTSLRASFIIKFDLF